MKTMKIAKCFLAAIAMATVTSPALGQEGTSISIEGAFSIGEGGYARGQGFVFGTRSGGAGRFSMEFATGALRSVRLREVAGYGAPGSTAFFDGPGVATILRNGRLESVRGTLLVYVDDLNMPGFPDQIFVRFATSRGEVLVRHGRVLRGDIQVVF